MNRTGKYDKQMMQNIINDWIPELYWQSQFETQITRIRSTFWEIINVIILLEWMYGRMSQARVAVYVRL